MIDESTFLSSTAYFFRAIPLKEALTASAGAAPSRISTVPWRARLSSRTGELAIRWGELSSLWENVIGMIGDRGDACIRLYLLREERVVEKREPLPDSVRW